MITALCEFPIYFYRMDNVAVYQDILRAVYSTRVQLSKTQSGLLWWSKYIHCPRRLRESDYHQPTHFPKHAAVLSCKTEHNIMDANNWMVHHTYAKGEDFINYRVGPDEKLYGERLTYMVVNDNDHVLRAQEQFSARQYYANTWLQHFKPLFETKDSSIETVKIIKHYMVAALELLCL